MAKKKFKQISKVSEIRFLAAVMCLFVPLLAFLLSYGLYINIGEGFRMSLFNAVSALSTSGFSTMAYDKWPQAAIGIMVILMLIGGGIGSTAGGLKLTRVYLMMRLCKENIQNKISSKRRVSVLSYYTAQGKKAIDQDLLTQTTGFVFTYLLIYIIGTLALTVTAECSLAEAMFEFASSLGTVGLSIGLTNPYTGAGTLIVEICGMVLGRLEIFIVLIAVYSMVVDKRWNKKKPKKIH